MEQLELYVEKMIAEGKVKREDLNASIDGKKEVSPVNDLNNIALVEGMQMGMIDNLGAMVGMLMMQINALEARITELEGGVANA